MLYIKLVICLNSSPSPPTRENAVWDHQTYTSLAKVNTKQSNFEAQDAANITQYCCETKEYWKITVAGFHKMHSHFMHSDNVLSDKSHLEKRWDDRLINTMQLCSKLKISSAQICTPFSFHTLP